MDVITICNLAIGMVGGNLIMSFSDETTEAEQCSLFYEPARTFCLESRDWTFASVAEKLIPAPVILNSEFAQGYLLPPKCLALRIVSATPDMKSPSEYQKDKRVIWSNDNPVYIKYTENITDTALFSPTFRIAVAHKLAEFISPTLTADKILKRTLKEESEELLEDGGAIDGMQGSPKRAYASRLLRARLGSYSYGASSTIYPWGY